MSKTARPGRGSSVLYRRPQEVYPTIVRGEGCYLWDEAGNRYLDLSSGLASAASIGYGRGEVADAMAMQARRLHFLHNARVTTDRQEELATRLALLAPAGTDRVMFTSGGSEAIELSIRIARQYYLARGEPGRWKVISFDQSYHGATNVALSLSGRPDVVEDYRPYLVPFPKIAPPVVYRGPFAALDPEEAGLRAADGLRDAIEAEGPETVAALVAEPILQLAGMAVPPYGFWPRIREICDSYGVLLVADEVATAFRTGTFLCMEHFGVTPDLTALAKCLGAGYAPLGAILVRREVAEEVIEGGRSLPGHSYGGNPLSCAVGLAVLDVIEREGLIDAARIRGEHLRSLLEDRLRDLPAVGDIRGLGLMQGVEYVRSRESREPHPPEAGVADSLWRGLWRRGVIAHCMRPAGTLVGDFTALVPPLVVTDSELERGVDVLREAIVEASAGWG